MKAVAVFLVVQGVVSLAATPGDAICCGDVRNALSPCITCVTGRGGSEPGGSCCDGVKSVSGSLQSKEDRQGACGCIKSAASNFNMEAAASLPGKCGVSVGVSTSPNMDCSQF